ncbi:MAG: hypothetical protein ACRCTQ_01595 [Brevinemataceae bacterium]
MKNFHIVLRVFIITLLSFPSYAKNENFSIMLLDQLEARKLKESILKDINPKSSDFDFNKALELLNSDRIPEDNALLNPVDDFVYFEDIYNCSELLTFQSNNTTFYNRDGFYHVNFSFEKFNQFVPPKTKSEILLIFYTPKRFAPLYNFDHKITLSAVGGNNKKLWRKVFNFNYREADQQILSKGGVLLKLTKVLSFEDLEQLEYLFKSNRKIYFRVESLEGSFDFVFYDDLIYFYKTFFAYAHRLNFY